MKVRTALGHQTTPTRVILAAAAVLLASPALAQEGSDNWSLAFGGATDYRSKGTSKTQGHPYAYGEVEWHTSDEQFYVAAAAATVQMSFGANTEMDVTAGYRPEIAGFSLDLNAMYRWYPDANSGADDEYWEFTADVSRSIGPVSGRLRVQYSPDNAGGGEDFTWVEGRVGYKINPKVKVTAAYGQREQTNARDYDAWNFGGTWKFADHAELDLRYYDTSASEHGKQYEDAVVAAVNLSF